MCLCYRLYLFVLVCMCVYTFTFFKQRMFLVDWWWLGGHLCFVSFFLHEQLCLSANILGHIYRIRISMFEVRIDCLLLVACCLLHSNPHLLDWRGSLSIALMCVWKHMTWSVLSEIGLDITQVDSFLYVAFFHAWRSTSLFRVAGGDDRLPSCTTFFEHVLGLCSVGGAAATSHAWWVPCT